MAHAHYAVQISHRQKDILTTVRSAMSTLVSDEILTVQSGLTFFLAIWSGLQTDCTDIYNWLKDPGSHPVRLSRSYAAQLLTLFLPEAAAVCRWIS